MFKIAQITDLHFNDFLSDFYKVDSKTNAKRIIEDVFKRDVDCIVLTGDFGNPLEFKMITEQIKAKGIPYYLTLGNHDEDEKIAPCRDISVQADWYFGKIAADGHNVILLNSHEGFIFDEQIEWLKFTLSECNGPVYIFLHHPVLDCGRTIMDKKYPLKNRKTIQKLLNLYEHEVYVFAGHYHNDFKIVSKNIKQYVTPSSLVQLSKSRWKIKMGSKQYGYRLIEINGTEVNTHCILF